MSDPPHVDTLPDAGDVAGTATSVQGHDGPPGTAEDTLAPSDAFQKLASDVRISVLVSLYRTERNGDARPSFAEIQNLVDSDSSARFAYHLRQLDGHFVRKTPNGYELTPAGRRAAKAVLSGTFTSNESRQAS